MLPEINTVKLSGSSLEKEYSSATTLMTYEETAQLLEQYGLLITQETNSIGELLR
jgi:hypothetical protein